MAKHVRYGPGNKRFYPDVGTRRPSLGVDCLDLVKARLVFSLTWPYRGVQMLSAPASATGMCYHRFSAKYREVFRVIQIIHTLRSLPLPGTRSSLWVAIGTRYKGQRCLLLAKRNEGQKREDEPRTER
jgi:hypothetical protein